ncbi:MAG: hypothetical protein MZV63_08985 [Marinilabiliales bacterium]|nr:hypothetical protein [Marinilabiliales bacterium]
MVYAGGETDFGLLLPDPAGRLTYNSLAGRIEDSTAKSEVGTILSIDADSNTVFFSDGRKLYLLDIESDSLSVIYLERDYGLRSAGRILALDKKTVLADDSREGLFEMQRGQGNTFARRRTDQDGAVCRTSSL